MRFAGFLLADRQLLDDRAGVVAHVDDAELQDIRRPQHRIDAGVEEREVAQRGMGLPAEKHILGPEHPARAEDGGSWKCFSDQAFADSAGTDVW
jgi:hypothetical protein